MLKRKVRNLVLNWSTMNNIFTICHENPVINKNLGVFLCDKINIFAHPITECQCRIKQRQSLSSGSLIHSASLTFVCFYIPLHILVPPRWFFGSALTAYLVSIVYYLSWNYMFFYLNTLNVISLYRIGEENSLKTCLTTCISSTSVYFIVLCS
jgi:hypothetical protein